MAWPTTADVDNAVPASGIPRPKTALTNTLLKSIIAAGSAVVGGSAVWGSITGLISGQADLQVALNGKSNVGHTHVPSDVSGLGTAATRNVPASGDAVGTGPTAQVVTSDDSRLVDTRVPNPHAHPESDVTGLQADLTIAKVDQISFEIDLPTNGTTYVLEEYAATAMTTAKLALRLASGTLTCKVTNAGADVTGLTGLTPTASQAASTATANNVLAVGGRTTLVITAATTPSALYGTLIRNRT